MANNRLLQKVLGIQYRMLRADFKLKLNRNLKNKPSSPRGKQHYLLHHPFLVSH